MRTAKNIVTPVLANLILVGLLCNFNGCSKNSELAAPNFEEQTIEEQNSTAKITRELNILKSSDIGLAKAFIAEKRITPSGGYIEVGDSLHGKSSVFFPALAVTESVDVRFWWESTGLLQGGSEFSPHGIEFNVPVICKLSYKDADMTGVNEDNLHIYYFNKELNAWEQVSSQVDTQKKQVTAVLQHFSRYAIGGE